MKIKNNVQVDDPNDMDKSSMYKIIGCTDIYLKTSGSIQQRQSDEQALDNFNDSMDVPANNINSVIFKYKEKIAGETGTMALKMQK